MADNIEKKVLVSIDVPLDEAKASMESLATNVKASVTELKNLKTAINNAKAAAAESNAEYVKEKANTQAARTEYQKKRTAILEANQALKASKQAVEAANGSYTQAQQNLSALGKAIKNTENGFNSSNKAVKAQIAEYNKLNDQLKKFDSQMGNHQREVGHYEKAFDGLKDKLGELIPGFNKFSSVLQTASQGFNAMKSGGAAAGEGAEAAGAGAEGAAAAMGGLVIAGAAVIGVLAAIAAHFAALTPNADALAQRFAYLKGFLRGFMDDIGTGVGFGQLADDMKKTAQEAANLKMEMQDLSRALAQDEVQDAKTDAQIAEINLKMRNRRNTPEQEKKYYDEIQSLAEDKYKGNIGLANKEYELAVRTATNSKRFSQEEKDRLIKDGIDYAIILEKTKGLVNGEDDIKAIVAAQQRQIATSREREMIEERAQNRLDAMQMKGEAAAAKAKNDLLEAQRANEEILNLRKAAIAKILQDEMEAFGKELSMNDEQYRQLIFKEQDFIKKQEQLRNKTKSPQAKAQYTKNISDAQSLIGVYGKGHAADHEKIVTDYFKKTEDLVIKGRDELAKMQIGNIQDTNKRELAAIDQQHATQLNGYKKEQDALNVNINRLTKERDKATGLEKIELQHALDQQLNLLGINEDKRLASLKKYQNDRAKIIKDASDRETEILDHVDVLRAKKADSNNSQKNDQALLAAEQKAVLDKYNVDVSQKGITDAQKLLLEQQYLDAEGALNDQYRAKQADKAIQWEKQVQSTATGLIQNAIQSNAQYAQVSLSKQKTFELNNQSLTSTQKAIIEEKYRIKEGQAKVKEFKANQKLQIANAIINGAVAIQKTTAELGWPAALVGDAFILAQTAAEVGVIAAQKPPAYATGGVHYSSDGRGGVLPGYSKTDNTNAYLRSGEAVVVSEAMQNPYARSLVSSINEAFGGRSFDGMSKPNPWATPGFAKGGVFSYLPTSDNGLRPHTMSQPSNAIGRLHPEDINAIAASVAMLPAPIVDVKDIGFQQERLSQVVDRGNY